MSENIYKRNLLIPSLKMLIDMIAIEAAFLFSYYLRFYSPLTKLFPVTKGYPSVKMYILFSLFLLLVLIILFGLRRAYRTRYFSSFWEDVPVVFKVCFLGILFAMSGAFLYRGFSYSRLVFLLIFINTNLFVILGRLIFHRLKRRLLRRGYGILKIGLIGSPEKLPYVHQRILADQNYKIALQGYFCDQPVESLDLPYLGRPEQLSEKLAESEIDGLMITFSQSDHQQIWKVVRATEGKNTELFYIPDVLDLMSRRFHSLEIGGLPLLQIKSYVLSGWQGFLKRSFDIVVSALALFVLSPLLALLAILVKLSSPGPVFYVQKRVGLDGREFEMLKFRSMRSDAEAQTGPVWARKDDPRVTPIGRFLRRTSLDELPQLINVLKGEMSLVGPRPERKFFVEQFRQKIPQYIERQRVRCGMTGWAQVNGLRGQSPIEERTKYDLYYIENWSLWFDLKIIFLTIFEIIRGENAY